MGQCRITRKSLVSKAKALKEKSEYLALDYGDTELADALFDQIQEYHSLDRVSDSVEIETLLLKQKEHDIQQIQERKQYPNLPKFSPSGASKCQLELYRQIHGLPVPQLDLQPYHKRWTRNASAIHEITQRDLLYMEKVLDNPRFTVKRLENGLAAWERNIHTFKEITYKGQTFIISGMCDGLLTDTITGDTVIFEYKTKSTTIAAVGTYKMKDILESHKLQGICYSILFMGDPFEDRDDMEVFLYESLAKDGWNKGEEARSDIRTFQLKITLEDRLAVLEKFADVVALTEEPEHTDCENFFCPLK